MLGHDERINMQDMQEMRNKIAEYESALAELDKMELVGGYIVRFCGQYITFDASPDGEYVFNPRPCKPHLARSFSWLQAKTVASMLRSSDCERGEVVHVRQAVFEVLDSYQAVVETIEAFAAGHNPEL